MGRENHTPPSSIRIPPALKKAAQAKAEAEGKTLTDVIVAGLERYVKSKAVTPPPPAGQR